MAIDIWINPIIVQIGPLAMRWYGLMYAVGIIVGLWVMIPYAAARGITEDDIWTLFWPAVIAGLIGARLYFVVQQPNLSAYLSEPWRILATWEGGMAFYGAVFGVIIALIIASRWRKVPILALLDAVSIFAVVGQGLGRIGNIINGDIVGYPTDGTWGFRYPLSPFVPSQDIYYQPAALYELLFNVVLFAILWTLRFRLRRSGMLVAVYLMLYSVGQFFMFFLRSNDVVAFGLKQAQVTAIVVLIAAIPFAWWVWRRGESITPVAVPEPPPQPAESR